jgi:hypothetical protein
MTKGAKTHTNTIRLSPPNHDGDVFMALRPDAGEGEAGVYMSRESVRELALALLATAAD